MNDQLTRRKLLERAALGGAAITFPGIVAACGGTSKKAGGTTVEHKLAKTLHFSNWPLYMDTKGQTFPSLIAFQEKTGTSGLWYPCTAASWRSAGSSRACARRWFRRPS